MKWLSSLLACVVLALPARAHFVWLLPAADGGNLQMVFSDEFAPDTNVPVAKIAQTKLTAWNMAGTPLPLAQKQVENHFLVTPASKPSGPWAVGGTCTYGVLAKGPSEPYLLLYHPQAYLQVTGKGLIPAGVWAKPQGLPLEIVPGKDGICQVLFLGKPAAGAEVVVSSPGHDDAKLNADAQGVVKLTPAKEAGLFGIRAKFIEPREGEFDGKKYKESRHYATLMARVDAATGSASKGSAADPAATRLLADARDARAAWKNFPGFSADLEINLNGKLYKGHLKVDSSGKVNLEVPGLEDKAWARREISSLVSHRMPGGPRETPCAFADDNAHHPLGRTIKVLNDELHSSYRIRDRQIMEVNRQMGDVRFTISVLENDVNSEKQFLPRAYVVNTWDVKTGDLKRSITTHNTWTRVGSFDLPVSLTVVDAGTGSQEVRSLRFVNHKLNP